MGTDRIYHLTDSATWQKDVNEPYRVESLDAEGFLHCSFGEQLAATANRFFAEASELLVLHIDPQLLVPPLKVESIPMGEEFPHIYGPLNRDAVVRVTPLERDEAGAWVFDPPSD